MYAISICLQMTKPELFRNNINSNMKNLLFPYHLFILLLVIFKSESIEVRVSNLTIGETSNNFINSNIEDIYRVTYDSRNTTLNITAWTNATNYLPLLIVIRQENGLISLQLPNKETGRHVQNLSRILCPSFNRHDSQGHSTVFIDIYTSSSSNVSYSIHIDFFKSFVVSDPSTIDVLVSPFAPVFFKYNMKSQSSIVKFTSQDKICTTVSVQRMACPVFDLKHTIDFAGQYQTMTQLASISVDNSSVKHNSMFIVISVHPTDKDCCDSANCSEANFHRIKKITIEINAGYDHAKINLNFAITLSVFLAIYIFICPFLCFVEPYSEKNLRILIDELKSNSAVSLSTTITPISNTRSIYSLKDKQRIQSKSLLEKQLIVDLLDNKQIESVKDDADIGVSTDLVEKIKNGIPEENTLVNEDNSFSSAEFDKVEDAENYKEVVRNKPNLKLSDLAHKQAKLIDRKIMNYPRLIIAIATFYVLPVVQLVFLYQTQLTNTGNEDSCYFNFLCMIKSGPFAAFNNIFSNIGYILLGIMFIIVVKKRAYSYAYMSKKYPEIMTNHGVPQHFGLFYTMGIGLIMEGILSAAYHVCPSYNNFQFDTSFMYIIGCISTIKLYQCRHPDIHPSSQKVFLFLAFCILVNVIGVFYGKNEKWFIIFYSVSHITFVFCLSIVIYYMKKPRFGMNTFKAMIQQLKQNRSITRPVHIERLVMLLIAMIFNIGLSVYGILVPTQFSSHLLNCFLGNFMLYFMMYLINKLINGETFHIVTICNLLISLVSWIAALYFFQIQIKHWEKKPAESREANRNCILLNVYDHHDAWHFLSALSMFMSFVVMLTIDDGIIKKKRNEIAVF